jgi:hypothetical protein
MQIFVSNFLTDFSRFGMGAEKSGRRRFAPSTKFSCQLFRGNLWYFAPRNLYKFGQEKEPIKRNTPLRYAMKNERIELVCAFARGLRGKWEGGGGVVKSEWISNLRRCLNKFGLRLEFTT